LRLAIATGLGNIPNLRMLLTNPKAPLPNHLKLIEARPSFSQKQRVPFHV
jgi:hypothetical protein